MAKVFTLFFCALFLAGCFGSGAGEKAQKADKQVSGTEETANLAAKHSNLTLDQYIDISAQIFCLDKNEPEIVRAELRKRSVAIIEQAGASEADFLAFQAATDKDPNQRFQHVPKILGQTKKYCQIIGGGKQGN